MFLLLERSSVTFYFHLGMEQETLKLEKLCDKGKHFSMSSPYATFIPPDAFVCLYCAFYKDTWLNFNGP